jgi:hypothetical protein
MTRLEGGFGAMARKITRERVAYAQREACPHRRTKIKRHPGNLVLPFANVVGHHPTDACIPKALQSSQSFDASALGMPSRQIHRDIDGRQKNQIARNPNDPDDEHHSNRTLKLW